MRAFGVDVRDSEAVEKIIRKMEHEFNQIDVPVMNAGRPGQWLTVQHSRSTAGISPQFQAPLSLF